MFEQTFLNTAQDARKPYSMVVSLILQIIVIAVLCVVPLVFTQVLPMMQMKSVLAAPPRPPAPAVKVLTSSTAHFVNSPTRAIRISDFISPLRPLTRMPESELEAPPDVASVGVPGGIPDSVLGFGSAPKPPAPPAPKPKPEAPHAIRVGTMSAASIIRMVQPPYPKIARDTHVEGAVEFTATISKEGTIENLALVHGHPLLVNAAREAVLQWRYRPTLLNGDPVEVITDIVVNFRLNQ